MKRIINKIFLLFLVVVFACPSFACGGYKYTVTLGDNGDLITNKGMGWDFCYYSNSLVKFGANLTDGDLLDDYPCDIVYFRIGWNFIQPDKEFAKVMGWTDEANKDKNGFVLKEEECTGEYFHWDLIDPIVEEWTNAGKRVAFRITANDGWGQCTPLWVKDAGAKGVEYDPVREGSSDKLTHVLELTCNSCNQTFDVDPDNDLLDGEGNDKYKCTHCENIVDTGKTGTKTDKTLYKKVGDVEVYTESSEETLYGGFTEEGKLWYDSTENGHVIGSEARKTWCPDYGDEIFLEAYKKLLIALRDRYSDDIEFIEMGSFGTWGEGHSNRALPTQKWLTKENALKHLKMHYEVFGNDYLVIVNDTMVERQKVGAEVIEYGFGCTDDSLQVPGMSGNNSAVLKPLYDENAVIGLETHPGEVAEQTYYDAVNECCASYARLIANPDEMKASEWTDKITKRLGYRFTFTEAQFSNLNSGGTFKAQLSLKNTGAARCTLDGYPAIVILAENGKEICKGISDFNVKTLETEINPDNLDQLQATTVSIKVDVPKGLSAGRYSVCVCVVDENGDAAFNLPLDDGYNMLYRIATFEVK